ncbi:tyrosine-protein phosphatase non-receptor type 7-like [Ptychodera flava]|uniref:tyrosine-protein phosphatase non-receptor type 7-like n=1 Tax=Ptychodera flava TaxID=63121 RepID=UPI00396A82F2
MGRYGLSRSLVLVLNIGWFCAILIHKSDCAPVSLAGKQYRNQNVLEVESGRVQELLGDYKESNSRNDRSRYDILKRSPQAVQRKDDAGDDDTASAFADPPLTTPARDDINWKYTLVVEVSGNRVLNSSQVQVLQSALAATLSVPEESVVLQNSHGNVFNMYVISEAQGGIVDGNLVPAADVESQLNVEKVNRQLPGFSVLNVLPQERHTIKYDDVPFWEASYFPYVIGALAALLVLLLALICYCCIKRRKQKKEEREATHVLYPPIKPEFKSGRMIQPESGQMYAPVARSQPIKIIKGLQERRSSTASLTIDLNGKGGAHGTHYGSPPKESSSEEYLSSAGNRMTRKQLRNSLKNVRALHEEFWDIPMNHPESIDVPGSGTKNRYRTILPNPNSRVLLPEVNDDPLSTYINANYVRGYDHEEKAFIATQGAMPHTISDFWRMIWFTDTPIIVMITKIKERNKVKCEHYWPHHKQDVYGEIEVCVDSTIKKDGYILRNMTLKYLEDTKQVKHFWYTAWPDHKTPDTAKQLLELVEEVERCRLDENEEPTGPVTVHCSAGLGRTGCFIAISIGVRQLQEESMVDILGIVCQMRLDRGGMIQTNEQYEFIHQALCLYEKYLPDPVID